MNRRWAIVLGCGALASILSAAYFWLPLIPFECVYHDGTGAHCLLGQPIQSPEQSARVAAVLKRYDEPYWRPGDVIVLVPLALAFDRELRWNYTSKASDMSHRATGEGE